MPAARTMSALPQSHTPLFDRCRKTECPAWSPRAKQSRQIAVHQVFSQIRHRAKSVGSVQLVWHEVFVRRPDSDA